LQDQHADEGRRRPRASRSRSAWSGRVHHEMTDWIALVPIKSGATRKSRLAEALSPEERENFADLMADHVLSVLERSPSVETVFILSAAPRAGSNWLADGGRGLNAELFAAANAFANHPILILHADLPELRPEDVETRVSASGGSRVAVAP